ncbi:hypothetical protein ACFSX9_06200 [Flavobacterium ardleyense]|uniref:Uncharacterized protein n=1 Tax=Flavobacterium ardleyense TaxID=2038737 RepID=A0ABW5Z6N4_9FLAO
MKKISISIPKPCNENWNAMLPEEMGRFCQSCSKTVIDFTKSSDAEITNYFQNNTAVKTCGRFKSDQLHALKIEIPEQILLQQKSFRNMFLLALLITMGTTLLSCKDVNNNSQPLGEIVVIQDSIVKPKDSVIQVEKTGEVTKLGMVICEQPEPTKVLKTQKVAEPPMITGEIAIDEE